MCSSNIFVIDTLVFLSTNSNIQVYFYDRFFLLTNIYFLFFLCIALICLLYTNLIFFKPYKLKKMLLLRWKLRDWYKKMITSIQTVVEVVLGLGYSFSYFLLTSYFKYFQGELFLYTLQSLPSCKI